MREPIHDICAWERRDVLERIEAALEEERPHPRRIYLRISPVSIDSRECSSTPSVTRLSEAEQGDIVALAGRLLDASKAVELGVVWCGDEPLCALDVIRNITDALRTVTAERGAGIRATVVTGGELLAFGSANPRTEERYDAGEFTTYYGRALAVVRAGEAGAVTVTVTDGTETKSAEIGIEEA